MKIYTKSLTLTLLTLVTSVSYGGPNPGPTYNTANICFGPIQNCMTGDVNLGAVGDKFSIDTQNAEVTNLGRITRMIKTSVSITSPGKKIYTFTPSEGNPNTRNRLIKILFITYKTPEGTEKEPWARTGIEIYRQLSGEDQWTELAISLTEAPIEALKPMNIELYPDARAIVYPLPRLDAQGNQVKVEPIIADLSR